jgi:hypothetical protein
MSVEKEQESVITKKRYRVGTNAARESKDTEVVTYGLPTNILLRATCSIGSSRSSLSAFWTHRSRSACTEVFTSSNPSIPRSSVHALLDCRLYSSAFGPSKSLRTNSKILGFPPVFRSSAILTACRATKDVFRENQMLTEAPLKVCICAIEKQRCVLIAIQAPRN